MKGDATFSKLLVHRLKYATKDSSISSAHDFMLRVQEIHVLCMIFLQSSLECSFCK
jgi:hypothetical protein